MSSFYMDTSIKRQKSIRVFKYHALGYVFLLPELIIFGIFVIIPVVRGLYLSFFEFSVFSSKFIGMRNFADTLTDKLFWKALSNTTAYTLMVVPGGLAVAVILSALIFRLPLKSQTFYKASFYLPGVISGVVVALTWAWLLDKDTGLMNYIFSQIGIERFPFLSHYKTALPTLAGITIIGGQGGSIVVLLANMSAISTDLYESASIDGANAVQQFRYVTVPMLKPTILYLLLMGTIGSYQVFDSIYVLTKGGPANSTMTVSYLIYSSAFNYFEFGKASAIATLLFLIIMTLSMIQFFGFRRKEN